MEQNGIGNMCLTVITNADTNISPMLTKKTAECYRNLTHKWII